MSGPNRGAPPLRVAALVAYQPDFCAASVSIEPMAVDLERYAPAPAPALDGPLRIGWVGTRTTQANLELIAEPLRRLGRSRAVALRVLGDEPMSMPGVGLDFVPWSFAREVPLLQQCQVGVVPVKPDVWSPWKFYFKLVQFMSLGLPVVASPVGSNLEIIEDGINGFLAEGDDQWHARLEALAADPDLRHSMGVAARRTAEARFGLEQQIDSVESLFRRHCGADDRCAAVPSSPVGPALVRYDS